MADFSTTNVAADIKTPQQMSLGDIMNMATNAQAYRQAQQMNPLLVQAQQGQTQLSQQQGQRANQLANEQKITQQWYANPDNYTTNGEIDLQKANKTLLANAPLTGADTIKSLANMAAGQATATQGKLNLSTSMRGVIGSAMGALGRAGVQDRQAYLGELDNLKKQYPDNPDMQKTLDGYSQVWANMPQGTNFAKVAIGGANTLLTPSEQQTLFAPTISAGAGGQPIVTQPSVQGEAPQQTAVQSGAAIPPPQKPNALVTMTYGPHDPSQPLYLQPGEADDIAAGRTMRQQVTAAVPAASQTAYTADQALQLADQAASTGAGKLLNLAKVETGNGTNLFELTKYVAQNSIAAANAQGIKTDQQTNNLANATGTTSMTPEALRTIMLNGKGLALSTPAYQQGLNKFIQKNGEVTGNANAHNFQAAWASNWDPRVFIVQGINSSGLSPAEKQLQIDHALSGLSDDQRRALQTKAINIKRLMNGDY